MKNAIKRGASRLGYLIRKRHSSELLSASVHRVKHPAGECRFLVFDPADAIQGCHVEGSFYGQGELQLILDHFRGGTFLDIGANVGNHSVYIAKARPAAKVKSFEPHPEAFALLSANVALNRLCGSVTVVNAALSDKSGRARIGSPHHNLGGSTLEDRIRGKSSFHSFAECNKARGDDVLGDERINFVKIDVEGHEMRCLVGLEGVLTKSRPPVFVEVDEHSDPLVSDFLASLGYRECYRDREYGLVRALLFTHS